MEDILSDASNSPTSSPPPVMEVQDVETHSSENIRSSSHSQQTKKPINQSIVWEHFKKVEPIDKDNPKAKCNYCSKLIGCHYRRNGTSPMMTHLTHGCPTSPLLKSKLSKGQTLLQMSLKKSVEGTTSNQLGFKKYDPEILRNGLAEYFIASELPFRHVESHSFRKWMNLVEPRFNVPSRTTLQKDCMKMCEREKLALKSVLRGKRICITTDTWTSIQNFNYMCVTAHFIDKDWILHKKIIKFCLISNHSGEEIGKMLESTLREWGIGGVYTITVDNASANKLGIEYLKKRLKDKNYTVLGAEFLHMRCAAHILNLVVQEGLDELEDCIDNIRNAIKYVRSSPSRMAMFKDCIQRENITCTKTVCLDVKTRWNSTYLMLCTAEKYEKAFELLGEEDHQFVVPSMIDWENARAFVKFLKTFYDATLKFSGSNCVTSNSYFMQLCIIQHTLSDGCLSFDPIMRSMSLSMKEKYEKYWGDIENNTNVNYLMFVAFVLDPRSKIRALTFWLIKCLGPKRAEAIVKIVKSLIKRLMDQYNRFNASESSTIMANVGSSSGNLNVGCDVLEDSDYQFRKMFSQHLEEEDDLACKSEFDRYSLDECEKTIKDFDILGWWKVNASKYPTLAEIARDVFAIPISTVASESAFSTGGRVLDCFRSSLSPLTAEALICTHDWIKNRLSDAELEVFLAEFDELDVIQPSSSSAASSFA